MTLVGPLLPTVALLAIWYVSYGYRAALGLDRLSRRGCLIVAFIVLQVLVFAISESVSVGQHFTTRGVGVAWLVVDGLVLVPVILLLRRGPGPRVRLRRLLDGVRATSVWERVLAGLAVAELGILAVIVRLYEVPTTNDSLSYHLTRVAHWVQNGSVHQYPSHYEAVNEYPPLHEYNMAHLHLLAGTDRLDAFVQLLAAVICVVGASEIARLLGGNRRAQIIAAAFAATIPSLILEATSTQNDLFSAAAAVSVLVTLLAWRPSGRFVITGALVGAAAGLGALTKASLVVFIATTALVLVVAAVVEQRRHGLLVLAKRVALSAVVALGVALALAVPFFSRNEQVYGGLSGPVSDSVVVHDQTVGSSAANVIRSVSGNFQIGDGTGVESWAGRTVRAGLHWLYEPLNIDEHDWHYTIGDLTDAFGTADYSGWQRSGDIGANPWHVCLIVVTLVLLVVLVLRGDRRLRVPLLLGLAFTVAFVIFTASIRWTPYGVRYQLPLLVAWCPLIALLVARARWAVGAVLVFVLLALATPTLLDTATRSLLHPEWDKGTGIEQHLRAWTSTEQQRIADGQRAAVATIADTSCTSVGLGNWIYYEYPIFIALRDEGWRGRIDHVGVQQPSARLTDSRIAPCAVIRQVDADYVSSDPAMVSLRFGPIALSLSPEVVVDRTPDQPGFHSDVLGVRVLPGSGWLLEEQPKIHGPAQIHVISNAERTVRLRVLAAGASDRTVELKPGLNTFELPGIAGQAAVIIRPV